MTGTSGEKIQSGLIAFRYYIHDTAQGYSLEMSGPFTRSCVPELASCWNTAKTTLRDRRLTLDVRRLTALDEFGQQWLASMTLEGARCLPESFLRDNAAGMPTLSSPLASKNVFRRVSEALRNCTQTKTVNADSARVTGR